MKKPQAYEATFRCVSVSRHRPGSNEPVAEHVGLTLDLADPTVKHGHRGAHLPLSPEQARTVAQMLIRHADFVEHIDAGREALALLRELHEPDLDEWLHKRRQLLARCEGDR